MNKNIGINQRAKDYVKIRNEDGNLVLRYRYIWELHNGKIPKGFFIHHINGNKKDDRIANLKLVSRKEHGLLHSK